MLWDNGSQGSAREAIRSFSFQNLSCQLLKSERISVKQNQDVEADNLINYPSQCGNNLIRKTLELQFPHHTLILTDQIHLTFHHKQLSNIQSDAQINPIRLEENKDGNKREIGKKLVLFRNKITRDIAQIRGDKKNIAKNVVTAFMNFLRDARQDGQNCDPQLALLKTLIDRTKYNNQLITLIVADNNLRPYFRNFLNSNASSWVQHSKLKNKDIHSEAIDLYYRLCNEKQSKRRQNRQKQREGMDMEDDQNQYLFQSNINHELEDEIKDFK